MHKVHSHVFAICIYTSMHVGRVTNCYDAMMKGSNASGVYTIHPINANSSFNVYCDMETDGGGWTVLLKRQDGSVDFYRNWAEYKRGFGNLEGEHWLGLDNMYLLTNLSGVTAQLRVDLADWEGNTAFAKYDQFSVGDEDSDYTLSVSGYQNASTAGDALKDRQNGQRFSTPDRDNDAATTLDCVVHYHGPWWHGSCYHSLLTGLYIPNGPGNRSSEPHGVIWATWKGHNYSLRIAEMKIRPGGV